MIVDAHAYCFPPLGEANGFPSAPEHLRYVQREMADHHQPVWRLTEKGRAQSLDEVARRARRQARALAALRDHDAGDSELREAGVSADTLARRTCRPRWPPWPTRQDARRPDDYAGVDRALLHTDHVVGELTTRCVRALVSDAPPRLANLRSGRSSGIRTPPWRRSRARTTSGSPAISSS
jgi:hypothetical protein